MGNKHDAKRRRKGGPTHYKKWRFHRNRSTKTDSTLPVGQMEMDALIDNISLELKDTFKCDFCVKVCTQWRFFLGRGAGHGPGPRAVHASTGPRA